jgi:glycerophosphoryl diester phosphodiesterase
MLIIGHRGSAGTKPQNTIASLREAIRVGADMIEFDIRLTKDKIPVLHHDFHTIVTQKKFDFIARNTLNELQNRTSGSDHPIVTLEQALKECFGKILINIEVKEVQAASRTLDVLSKFIKKTSDWDQILISSSKPLVLLRIRKRARHAKLAMVHTINPLSFILWERQLRLTAVGFHRLHLNPFSTEVAKQLGLVVYVYTVNRPQALMKLAEKGVDAVVTDYPARMLKEL